LHGDVLMWLMKTLLTSRCINQRGAGQLDSANMILSKTFLNTEVARHKSDLINSIQKAVHFLRECNPPRPELAEKLNIALGLLIESVTD
ncbi:hypothetical protein, partial [Klebsiella pneumoniae]|uniref:hypothetical protein n=1 Tax=Klebsiella pneumoniae TaxID=573 RepID=UPI0021C11171